MHVIVVSLWRSGRPDTRSFTRWRLHSVLSELEPLWLCWSAEAALAEVGTGLAFSLKSVIITVRSPTVTSRCRALLLSMFFNLGLTKKREKHWVWEMANPSVQRWWTETIPHLFTAFPSQRHLFFTPVRPFLLFFFVRGRRKLLIYLLCDQLRDGAWFSERDKKGTMKCVTQYDHKGELDRFTTAQLEDQLPSRFSVSSTWTSHARHHCVVLLFGDKSVWGKRASQSILLL